MLDHKLTIFYHAAKNLSVTRAAEALRLTQPAVSKSIKELETELGITLFNRERGRLTLTPAGEFLLAKSEDLREAEREIAFGLQQLKETFSGTIHVGASTTLAQYILPTLLALFRRKYPKINIDLTSGNTAQIERALLARDIQVAFIEGAPSQPDIHYIPFVEDEIVLVTRTGNPCPETLPREALRRLDFALREKDEAQAFRIVSAEPQNTQCLVADVTRAPHEWSKTRGEALGLIPRGELHNLLSVSDLSSVVPNDSVRDTFLSTMASIGTASPGACEWLFAHCKDVLIRYALYDKLAEKSSPALAWIWLAGEQGRLALTDKEKAALRKKRNLYRWESGALLIKEARDEGVLASALGVVKERGDLFATLREQSPEQCARLIAVLLRYNAWLGARAAQDLMEERPELIVELDALVPKDIQCLGRTDEHRYFYDLKDIMNHLDLTLEERESFESALDDCIVYAATTGRMIELPIDIEKFCGLSSYCTNKDTYDDFYKTLSWNQATGMIQ